MYGQANNNEKHPPNYHQNTQKTIENVKVRTTNEHQKKATRKAMLRVKLLKLPHRTLI